MLKIVADDRIPFVAELFKDFGEIMLKPGIDIQKDDLLDADVLLVRSITPVNSALLEGTAVKFIGSATAGFDHIDREWLKKQHVAWAYAPGANAVAVAEYVLCCVAFLRSQKLLLSDHVTAGVVGIGHVGSVVSNRLQQIGVTILQNDPPRAQCEESFQSIPLDSLTHVDLLCLHTPLTYAGAFPTHHLIDDRLLAQLKSDCVLLNAGRGAVVNNEVLLRHNHVIPCLDVWENEPDINVALLKKAIIASPHIAGYSKSAKLRATFLIYEQFLKYFQLPDIHRFQDLQSLQEKTTIDISNCHTAEGVLLKIYDPGKESQIMRDALLNAQNKAHHFEQLRRQYPLRNEFSTIQLNPSPPFELEKALKPWGFN